MSVDAERARGLRVDAAARAGGLPLDAMVGGLVSGRRARRRWLRRAAHLLGEDGARRRARDALLPGRALRASSVAVDRHRPRHGHPVSQRCRTRKPGYVHAFVDLLPTPWRGFMLAGFAAAYMSTIGTHLNWGASYLVNDFYKRFVKKDATREALRERWSRWRRSSCSSPRSS